jgi:hypothetical protein
VNNTNALSGQRENFNTTALVTYVYQSTLNSLLRKQFLLDLWLSAHSRSKEEEWLAVLGVLESDSGRCKFGKSANFIVDSMRNLTTWDRYRKWMWGLRNGKGRNGIGSFSDCVNIGNSVLLSICVIFIPLSRLSFLNKILLLTSTLCS